MKVLLINGSPREKGCTYTALKQVSDALNLEGVTTEIYHLKNDMPGCLHCHYCHTNESKQCVYHDDVNLISNKLDEYDGFVIGTPVYNAGPNGALKSFLDRLFFSNSIEKFKFKAAACVTNTRRVGSSLAFCDVNMYFTISSMNVIGSTYWPLLHGSHPEEAKRDLEGMQALTHLGLNMAYYLKMRELAKQHNLNEPIHEKRIFTDFIKDESYYR